MRTFFAIDLPLEHKRKLGVAMDALKLHLKPLMRRHSLRWVRPENLHITLQFMAHLKEGDMPGLLQQVREAMHELTPFHLKLGGLEWFPSAYLPHVLSVETAPHDPLAELAARVGGCMQALGYAIEHRPFRGHLTLARVQGLRDVGAEVLGSFEWPVLDAVWVREIVLFKSETRSEGAVYTPLESVEL